MARRDRREGGRRRIVCAATAGAAQPADPLARLGLVVGRPIVDPPVASAVFGRGVEVAAVDLHVPLLVDPVEQPALPVKVVRELIRAVVRGQQFWFDDWYGIVARALWRNAGRRRQRRRQRRWQLGRRWAARRQRWVERRRRIEGAASAGAAQPTARVRVVRPRVDPRIVGAVLGRCVKEAAVGVHREPHVALSQVALPVRGVREEVPSGAARWLSGHEVVAPACWRLTRSSGCRSLLEEETFCMPGSRPVTRCGRRQARSASVAAGRHEDEQLQHGSSGAFRGPLLVPREMRR